MTGKLLLGSTLIAVWLGADESLAMERLIGAPSARVMSQSTPWIAT